MKEYIVETPQLIYGVNRKSKIQNPKLIYGVNPKSVLESFGVRESTPQTFRKI
ncbi:MAG: hypothetical protein HC836_15235 [Richelia sp. RM2_1_2]|nr:hypothetical protein [Richelia sp. SM1_7_0]NJN09565.1 hypothetical protein [Richelia sp. RM1_1_1]NJO29534.1 hypothetical protein [Richelia sp. SL_2_1]NJO59598.1 hypothetical protein [Richelia sp. RM2_1_2]